MLPRVVGSPRQVRAGARFGVLLVAGVVFWTASRAGTAWHREPPYAPVPDEQLAPMGLDGYRLRLEFLLASKPDADRSSGEREEIERIRARIAELESQQRR